jgi:hypothetical protein
MPFKDWIDTYDEAKLEGFESYTRSDFTIMNLDDATFVGAMGRVSGARYPSMQTLPGWMARGYYSYYYDYGAETATETTYFSYSDVAEWIGAGRNARCAGMVMFSKWICEDDPNAPGCAFCTDSNICDSTNPDSTGCCASCMSATINNAANMAEGLLKEQSEQVATLTNLMGENADVLQCYYGLGVSGALESQIQRSLLGIPAIGKGVSSFLLLFPSHCGRDREGPLKRTCQCGSGAIGVS